MDAELETDTRTSFEVVCWPHFLAPAATAENRCPPAFLPTPQLCDCDEVLVRYSNARRCDRPLRIAFLNVTYATYVRDRRKLGRFEQVVIEF